VLLFGIATATLGVVEGIAAAAVAGTAAPDACEIAVVESSGSIPARPLPTPFLFPKGLLAPPLKASSAALFAGCAVLLSWEAALNATAALLLLLLLAPAAALPPVAVAGILGLVGMPGAVTTTCTVPSDEQRRLSKA
jgi:hypothetical protein